MYRVLLPVDRDPERGLAAAEAVASLPSSSDCIHVTILNMEKRIDVTGGDGGNVDSNQWFDEDDIPESVDGAKEFLQERDIDVDVVRRHADPAEGIMDAIEQEDIDHVFMSGRKKSPVGKALFGSVTQSVLLDSPVPVTVVTS